MTNAKVDSNERRSDLNHQVAVGGGAHLRLLGNIRPTPESPRDASVVAALAAGYIRHKEPLLRGYCTA